jgi:hypothetical protein
VHSAAILELQDQDVYVGEYCKTHSSSRSDLFAVCGQGCVDDFFDSRLEQLSNSSCHFMQRANGIFCVLIDEPGGRIEQDKHLLRHISDFQRRGR